MFIHQEHGSTEMVIARIQETVFGPFKNRTEARAWATSFIDNERQRGITARIDVSIDEVQKPELCTLSTKL